MTLKNSTPLKNNMLRGLKMPREQRDTLFILAVLTFILIPHFFYLPVWAIALTLSTLVWRAWLTREAVSKLPNAVIKTALLVFFVGLTLVTYKSILGPEAGGCLLVTLVALKSLELKARRDALVIFYLGFFLIMMGFFHSQNIPTAFVLLIGLLGLFTALVNAHMPAGRPPLKEPLKIAAWLMFLGVPLMLALFLSFPRLGPLWGVPDSMIAKTGVSDEMTIDSISQLVQNNAIAFRIKFEDKAPLIRDMYFRGPVLDEFDGKTWRTRPTRGGRRDNVEERSNIVTKGKPILYEVTMESTNQPWLFTLDLTAVTPELSNTRAYMSNTFQWINEGIVTDRLKYKAEAYSDYQIDVSPSPRALAADTQLPQGSNPRTQAWAAELMNDPQFSALDTKGKANWLLEYIQKENFYYTLTPPLGYAGESAADQLWFDYKEGFCQHYAFAFTILMRSMGIPSRIVSGYQGAERNYIDDYWVVRQSSAHAWTEVWQEGEGWIRVDPTGAIAPHRILTGMLDQNITEESVSGFTNLGMFDKLLMRWDAWENAWNQWVLAYNVGRGLNLLEKIGFKAPSIATLIKIFAVIFAFITLTLLGWIKWKESRRDPWSVLSETLYTKLEKAGFKFSPSTGPRRAAEALEKPSKHNGSLKQARSILLKLEKARYAPTLLKEDAKQTNKALKQEIKQLKITT